MKLFGRSRLVLGENELLRPFGEYSLVYSYEKMHWLNVRYLREVFYRAFPSIISACGIRYILYNILRISFQFVILCSGNYKLLISTNGYFCNNFD